MEEQYDHGHKKEEENKNQDESFGPSYSFSSDTSGGPIDFSKKKVRPVIRDSSDREFENEQKLVKMQAHEDYVQSFNDKFQINRAETCFNVDQTLKRTDRYKIQFEMQQ